MTSFHAYMDSQRTALSGLANLASSSGWERFLMGPVALLLAFLCLVVALGGARMAR